MAADSSSIIREFVLQLGWQIDESSHRRYNQVLKDTDTQCHFFAGIGVWSYALRQASWSDDRPVWTGSCPCQPFSAAGKGNGFADERHLWPAFFHLIRACGPVAIFGEQVASPDGLAWLDLVQTDLEAENYTPWAADICAAGIGAPHIRQRLYWLAYATGSGSGTGLRHSGSAEQRRIEPTDGNSAGWMANPDGRHTSTERQQCGGELRQQPEDCLSGYMGNPEQPGLEGYSRHGNREVRREIATRSITTTGPTMRPEPTNGFWRDADWLGCRDDKWRPVEPGTFPLVTGAPSRVGRLRAYGNAINAEQATAFIDAAKEVMP